MRLSSLHWSLYFLIITLGIVIAGAMLGAFVFSLFGLLTGAQFTVGELMRNGAHVLGFYFMMWAPGIALVTTVMRAHARRVKARVD